MEKNNIFAIIATILLTSVIFFVPNSAASEELTGGMAPIHLNMKEAANLSPETWGDLTKEATKDNPPRSWTSQLLDQGRTREWKDVGTWTASEGINFDISLSSPIKFNLWWRETNQGQDDSYDAQVQYRFRLNIDGVDSAYYTDSNGDDFTEHECAETEPCQWLGETNSLNVTSATKGTTFEIKIEYLLLVRKSSMTSKIRRVKFRAKGTCGRGAASGILRKLRDTTQEGKPQHLSRACG